MAENHEIELLKKNIKLLKRQNRFLIFFISLSIITLCIYSFKNVSQTKVDEIRTDKIVIEDDEGNDRIIIAADISRSVGRQRKDSVGGMLILNELGHDQVLIGHSRTAQFDGKIITRMGNAKPYGLFVNDSIGDERGGITYYNDRKLAAVGLDNSSGEGVHLFAAEDSLYLFRSGMLVQKNGGTGFLFAGEMVGDKTGIQLNSGDNTTGIYSTKDSSFIIHKNEISKMNKKVLSIYPSEPAKP